MKRFSSLANAIFRVPWSHRPRDFFAEISRKVDGDQRQRSTAGAPGLAMLEMEWEEGLFVDDQAFDFAV